MSRDLRELRLRLRLREGLHIMVGLRRGLVLLQGLIVLALYLLELSLLLCGPHLVLGVKESVEAGLDVGPPKISRLLAVSIKSNWTYILVVLIMASTLGEELSLLMSRSTPAEGLSAGRTVPTWLGLSIGGMI